MKLEYYKEVLNFSNIEYHIIFLITQIPGRNIEYHIIFLIIQISGQ